MRLLLPSTLLLLLVACAGGAAPPATAASSTTRASAQRTRIDHDDIALELPGKWEERRLEDGYDLRRGDQEQIIVATMPIPEGVPVDEAVAHLAEAQRIGLGSQCKGGLAASEPAAARVPAHALRLHAVCAEPRVVATFVAAPLERAVLSFEHYRYDGRPFSADLERDDEAVLATARVKAPAATCPEAVLTQAQSGGGACLEAAVLGSAVVEDCARAFKGRGWLRDDATAELIGRSTAKKLVCFHHP
jgi:hypothetical protein